MTRYYALSGALVQLLRAYAVTSGRSPSGVQSALHEVAYFAPCNWSFRSYINEWIVLRGLIISAHMIKAIYMQKLVEHSILLYWPHVRLNACLIAEFQEFQEQKGNLLFVVLAASYRLNRKAICWLHLYNGERYFLLFLLVMFYFIYYHLLSRSWLKR